MDFDGYRPIERELYRWKCRLYQHKAMTSETYISEKKDSRIDLRKLDIA